MTGVHKLTSVDKLLLVCGLAAMATSMSHSGVVASSAKSLAADGRVIFLTGKDRSGKQIVASKTPLFRSCAACHRADGSGGVHLPGGAVSADLRHAALVTAQKHPYTLKSIERAISSGVDNEGQPLNPVMPRWRLSRPDLNAVSYYVFTKLK